MSGRFHKPDCDSDRDRSLSFILSASQIGFYFVTGSEIRWDAATTVGNDPEGRKLMLSGLRSFLGAASVLLVISWILKYWIFILISCWMSALFSAKSTEKTDEEAPLTSNQRKSRVARLTRFWTVCAAVLIGALRLIRPQVPYNHMSGAIPFSFLQALGSRPAEMHQTGDQVFPFASLVDEPYWEGPHDHFKGWAPGRSDSDGIKINSPAWASGSLPQGFERWSKVENDRGKENSDDRIENGTSRKNSYSPIDDPLRISNLDRDLLAPIAQALENHKVPITHVVLILMESARKDIFPFKAGSHLHKEILSSYNTQTPEILQNISAKLSHLTPNAEKLTGEASGFPTNKDNSGLPAAEWIDTTEPGMGGININGVLTGSSLSFKSAIMNYCGVGPLPVNFMDEVNAQNYQPCIMQIFELFNQLKENSIPKGKKDQVFGTGLAHIHDRNWSSVFMQSITGQYDEQDILNTKMGFQKSIYREDIDEVSAKYYHEDMEEINYFG